MDNEQRIKDQHNYIRQLHDAVYHKNVERQRQYTEKRRELAKKKRLLGRTPQP